MKYEKVSDKLSDLLTEKINGFTGIIFFNSKQEAFTTYQWCNIFSTCYDDHLTAEQQRTFREKYIGKIPEKSSYYKKYWCWLSSLQRELKF